MGSTTASLPLATADVGTTEPTFLHNSCVEGVTHGARAAHPKHVFYSSTAPGCRT